MNLECEFCHMTMYRRPTMYRNQGFAMKGGEAVTLMR